MTTTNYDAALDEQKVYSQLPKLTPGEYVLAFKGIEHTDGAKGVFDIVEAEVVSSEGDAALEPGQRTKLWFQRDARGEQKEREDKKLVRFLVALNGGEKPASPAEFIADLRAGSDELKDAKFALTATAEIAKKSGRPFTKIEFSAAQ